MEYFVISAKFVLLKYYTLSSQLRRLTSFSVGCSGRRIPSPNQIAVMRKWSIGHFVTKCRGCNNPPSADVIQKILWADCGRGLRVSSCDLKAGSNLSTWFGNVVLFVLSSFLFPSFTLLLGQHICKLLKPDFGSISVQSGTTSWFKKEQPTGDRRPVIYYIY